MLLNRWYFEMKSNIFDESSLYEIIVFSVYHFQTRNWFLENITISQVEKCRNTICVRCWNVIVNSCVNNYVILRWNSEVFCDITIYGWIDGTLNLRHRCWALRSSRNSPFIEQRNLRNGSAKCQHISLQHFTCYLLLLIQVKTRFPCKLRNEILYRRITYASRCDIYYKMICCEINNCKHYIVYVYNENIAARKKINIGNNQLGRTFHDIPPTQKIQGVQYCNFFPRPITWLQYYDHFTYNQYCPGSKTCASTVLHLKPALGSAIKLITCGVPVLYYIVWLEKIIDE